MQAALGVSDAPIIMHTRYPSRTKFATRSVFATCGASLSHYTLMHSGCMRLGTPDTTCV